MLVIVSLIRVVFIVFLEVISVCRLNAHNVSCYKVDDRKVCYFQPSEASRQMTWDDAWKVCKKNNSTLPLIENRMLAKTLRTYVETKTSLNDQIWLAGREIRSNVWQWLSGKPFRQQDLFGNPDNLLKRYEINPVLTGSLEYLLSYGRENKSAICHYKESRLCPNTSIINWKSGCLYVINDEELNLVDARNRCLDKGGDLATFEAEEVDLRMLRNYSSLLIRSRHYWIGLRLNWWIWNQTDSYTEIKYSNWSKYENLLYTNCLYIHLYNYKWNQDSCTTKKPFLCRKVEIAEKHETDVVSSFSTTRASQEADAISHETLIAIIGSVVAVVIIAAIVVVMVVILKVPRSRKVSHDSVKKQTSSREMSAHSMENKTSVESNTIADSEMSNQYAEIPRTVDLYNNDECGDESQPGIVYAALEFDANKGTCIYEEPDISSPQKQQRSAPAKPSAVNGNGQTGNSAEYSALAPEGTIYANF